MDIGEERLYGLFLLSKGETMTEFNTPKHYVLAEGSDSMDALEKILGSEEFKGFLR